MKIWMFLLFLTVGLTLHAQPFKTQNVIIVTLDGFRWQEVFTGADSVLINNKSLVNNVEEYKDKYWKNNPYQRREVLMPFLWETIARKGQLYGNRQLGCKVNVSNPYWFSYPGYSEIFCGYADIRVNSNDYGPNPNSNFLETIHQTEGFHGKVAAFTSWAAFRNILNKDRCGFLVNAAFDNLTDTTQNPQFELMNKIQNQLPDVFYGVRLDAVTFHMGFEYLKEKRPRVLYLSFDETDDFAHKGKYDYYLNSAHYTDGFLKELWQWVQSQDDYKDKTTLFITVDHGRGNGELGWRNHGKSLSGASSQTWFAVIGPDTAPLGEIENGQYYNSQFAQTITSLLGVNYQNAHPIGETIAKVTENKILLTEVSQGK